MTTPTMARVTRVPLDHVTADTWQTQDGRFVVVRVPGVRNGTPLHYRITDTTRTDWVDRPGQGNVVHVFELDDARSIIAKAIRNTPSRTRRTV